MVAYELGEDLISFFVVLDCESALPALAGAGICPSVGVMVLQKGFGVHDVRLSSSVLLAR